MNAWNIISMIPLEDGGFDIGKFFSNLTEKAKEWGGYFIAFLGLVLVIIGIVQIVKAFASHGRGQVNWLMTLGMILVGGFLLASSMGGVLNFANIGVKTLEQTAEGGGEGATGT